MTISVGIMYHCSKYNIFGKYHHISNNRECTTAALQQCVRFIIFYYNKRDQLKRHTSSKKMDFHFHTNKK